MRAPNGPLISKSSNAMPGDKPNPHGQRPLVPTLSLSSTKTVNTTPLTPRVAGSIPSNISTPLLRRAIRPDITPNNGHQRDERTTPMTSFLSNNITPRSGSRKSRVDSASSTPTGTPTGTPTTESLRIPADNPVYGAYGGGFGLAPHDGPPTKPTVSFGAHTAEVGSVQERPQPQSQSQTSRKFFYASDVKPSSAQPLRQRPVTQKHNNFLYANGNAIPSSASLPGLIQNVSGVEEKSKAKFFHANGTPDTVVLPLQPFTRPGSTVSTSSYIVSPRFAPQSPICSQRPASPTKYSDNVANYLPPSISTHSLPLVSPPCTSPPNPNETTTRDGFDSSDMPLCHFKSPSVGYLDLRSAAAELIEGSDLVGSRDARPGFVNRTSMSSADDGSEHIIVDDISSVSGFRSPVKAGDTLERLNELAANARQERKVLDLEITNSSLAAINRTLEREMRKQSAELRRYRRLSRSGRLSINTVMSRSSTGSLLMANGIDAGQLSDMSEEEEDADDSSELDSVDDGALSPTALAESDARHRKRDEERLQLDLTKHQQLLVDSQKMNQSLKRCLGWTEELINAGKRALAYQIHVSDVELGGRVLIADEDYQDEIAMHEESSMPNRSLDDNEDSFQNLGKDDRDSGVDLGQQHAALGIDGEIRITRKS